MLKWVCRETRREWREWKTGIWCVLGWIVSYKTTGAGVRRLDISWNSSLVLGDSSVYVPEWQY